jgi:GABA permease
MAAQEAGRLVVIANETLAGTLLGEEIYRKTDQGRRPVFVVAPALNSRLRSWYNDNAGALAAARKRLDSTLEYLRDAKVTAEGDVGDEDPVVALQDALCQYTDVSEVLVSTHPPERSNWLEKGVVDRIREQVGSLPVEHVIIDLSKDEAARRATHAG